MEGREVGEFSATGMFDGFTTQAMPQTESKEEEKS